MIRNKYKFINILYVSFFFLLFIEAEKGYAQTITNKGTEFWAPFMTIDDTPPAAKMKIYLTAEKTTTAKLAIESIGWERNANVIADQIIEIDIPKEAYIDGTKFNKIINLGIHITSDLPIVAYGHIFAPATASATLIYPIQALGTLYYTMNYETGAHKADSYSQFAIIAPENDTKVKITPTQDLADGRKANQSFEIILQKGQLFQATTAGYQNSDLTGSIVESIDYRGRCKPIAVFSGTSWSAPGCNKFSSGDILFKQMPPISTWGKEFIAMPFKGRENYLIRILVKEPANIEINGVKQYINKGFYTTGLIESTALIKSDKPILAVQYMTSIYCDKNRGDGDPEMIILSSKERGIKHATIYSTHNQAITSNYINILIKKSSSASLRIDGNKPNATFQDIRGTDYVYLQETIGAKKYTITADDVFNAFVYGHGSLEGYSYSAGANMQQDLFAYITTKVDQKEVDTSCINTPVEVYVSTPMKTEKLFWDFGNGIKGEDSNPINITNEAPFVYKINTNLQEGSVQYDKKDVYSISIKYQPEGTCGLREVIKDIAIEDIPDLETTDILIDCNDLYNLVTLTDHVKTNPPRNDINISFEGPGINGNTFHPVVAGYGKHTIKIDYGNKHCSASKNMTIEVKTNETKVNIKEKEINLKPGQTYQAEPTVSSGNKNYTITWSPEEGLSNPVIINPKITAGKKDILYTVTVTNDKGCVSKDNIWIRVYEDLKIYEAFSPNGDGINDTWIIPNIEYYPECEVYVYDRYGDQVFYSQGYKKPWDGTLNNTSLPTATYYYVVKPNRKTSKSFAGSVTILR